MNLFDDLPDALPEELTQILLEAPCVRIERIVSRGHASPEGFWYDQEEHEWVLLLQGNARLAFAEGIPEIEMRRGDHLTVPARQRHRVAWTDPTQDTIWLAVFFAP